MGWQKPFSSDALKLEYQSELQEEKVRLTRTLVLLAALFNLAFFWLDQWAIRSALAEVWLVRIVLFLVLAIALYITWQPWFQRLYTSVIVFIILTTGAAINTMIYLASADDLARDVYYGGLLLISIGLYTMTYVSLWLSLVLSGLLIAGYLSIAVFSQGYLALDKIVVLTANLFFFISTTVIGMVGKNVREGYSQENYLLRHSLQRDVEIKEEEKTRAAYLAEHDALTGLPTRVRFETDAVEMIEAVRATGKQAAFMFIDLDGFKDVNDTHGHAVGDRVLKVIATRLGQCIREGDIICRFGGDEFVIAVVVEDAADDVIEIVGAKIAQAVGEEVILRGHALRLSASIGVACSPSDGDDLQSVLIIADRLMYRVKRSGKAGIARTSGFDLRFDAEGSAVS